LPVTGAKLPPAALAPAGRASIDSAAVVGASILIVEDEAALAAAITDALEDAGYAVQRAGDGEEALDCVKAGRFDLVICDLKMPRLDGPSFHRELAAASPELSRHVIFVTGDMAEAKTEKFLEESGCRWLAKPFRLADLLRAVKEELS
jgi:DNA-binding response OmpR family regulator